MNVQAIKAELYDLQSHVCNGRLTVTADGSRDTNDRPCSGCSRIRELQHQLREATEAERRKSLQQREHNLWHPSTPRT